MQYKNWYISGFAMILIFFGIAVVADSCQRSEEATNRQEMIRACGEMCGGEVESFELDWRRAPVCTCR